MHYWYESKNKKVEDLQAKYPVANHADSATIKDAMNSWQKEAEIAFTPTIYVNGYLLPKEYKTEDLKKIL